MEEVWRRRAIKACVESLVCIRASHAAEVGPMDAARVQFLRAELDAEYHYRNVPRSPRDVGTRSERAFVQMLLATAHVVLAVNRMKLVVENHAAFGNIFSHCALHLGLQAAPGWLAWEEHHAATAAHANRALQMLETAMSSTRGTMGALFRLKDSPPLSPLWNQLGHLVGHALRFAREHLDASALEVRPLQSALVLEFAAARRLLLA